MLGLLDGGGIGLEDSVRDSDAVSRVYVWDRPDGVYTWEGTSYLVEYVDGSHSVGCLQVTQTWYLTDIRLPARARHRRR